MHTEAIAPKAGHAGVSRWAMSLGLTVVLVGWVLFLYYRTGWAMVTIWLRSETFTHDFLVAPIVLWLIWRRRQDLQAMSPVPKPWVLWLIAGAAFVWLLGDMVSVNSVTQLALVTLLILLVPVLMGGTVTRKLIFPLAFLYFAVPLGEFLMPLLMEWTANFTVMALRLSGIPVYREGLQFVIPSGTWSVVEACSGIRYLIASVTVGTLFAYLNYQSTKRRLLFIAVAILVPVVANWLRAYMIVMLGHLSNNKIATGVDHLIYGWLFFGLVIMLMFIIGARWTEPEPDSVQTPRVQEVPAVAKAANQRTLLTALAVGGVVALPQLAMWAMSLAQNVGQPQLAAPSSLSATWLKADQAFVEFRPAFVAPDAQFNETYKRMDHNVGLYVGFYRHQNYSHKLVSSANALVVSNDDHWAMGSQSRQTVDVAGQAQSWRTTKLHRTAVFDGGQGERLYAWQIYWINGKVTDSDYLAKIYGAYDELLGRGDDSAVIVVYTLSKEAATATSTLNDFVATNYAEIDKTLKGTRFVNHE